MVHYGSMNIQGIKLQGLILRPKPLRNIGYPLKMVDGDNVLIQQCRVGLQMSYSFPLDKAAIKFGLVSGPRTK